MVPAAATVMRALACSARQARVMRNLGKALVMHRSFRTIAIGALAVSALAGCGGTKTPDAAASSEGAAANGKAAMAAKPRAGHWDVKLKMTDFQVPGMPDSIRQSVAKQMDQVGAVGTCLTPEEAARNDGKFFGPRNRNCTYQDFSMANGQVAAKMTCTDRGMKQTVTMKGSYGADAYDLTLASKGDINGQPMTMAMHVTGHRTGDCTGAEKN